MGIFDFLKPKIDIVIEKLKKEDINADGTVALADTLYTQGLLLEQLKNSRKWKSGESLTYVRGWYTYEHANLLAQNVSIEKAMLSLDKWKRAKTICNENNFSKGEQFFENFVKLYSHYIETLNKLNVQSNKDI
jgi:hypothetical protein